MLDEDFLNDVCDMIALSQRRENTALGEDGEVVALVHHNDETYTNDLTSSRTVRERKSRRRASFTSLHTYDETYTNDLTSSRTVSKRKRRRRASLMGLYKKKLTWSWFRFDTNNKTSVFSHSDRIDTITNPPNQTNPEAYLRRGQRRRVKNLKEGLDDLLPFFLIGSVTDDWCQSSRMSNLSNSA